MSLEPGHYVLPEDGGEAIWFLGTLATVKAGRAQSGNALSVVEIELPAGFAPPPHIHHMEDEAFYILGGITRGFCGEEQWEAGPGAFVWLPRGIPHGFTIDEGGPARHLVITAPLASIASSPRWASRRKRVSSRRSHHRTLSG